MQWLILKNNLPPHRLTATLPFFTVPEQPLFIPFSF
jgi:hypothetical protein